MSNIEKLQKVMKTFETRFAALKIQLMNEFEGEIKSIFTEVFDAYPDIEKIGWTQYTPYFNDGEPCVFNVYDIYFKLFIDTNEDEDEDDNDLHNWRDASWGDDSKNYPLLKQLADLLSSSDDVLLMLFGDHCKIIATRAGLDVEEYEHE